MKQQLSLLSAVICGLFALTLIYLGAFLHRQFIQPYQSVTAEAYTEEDILTLKGVVVREETVIRTIGHHIDFTADSGQTLSKGTPVAVVETRTVTTPAAGIFLQELDGYEHLTPDKLRGLTPGQLNALLDDPRVSVNSAGKVVTGFAWYFAAPVAEADAAQLQVGQVLQLDMGEPINASVIHISSPEDGLCAVVFRCSDHLQSVLHTRELTVSLVRSKIQGLQLPARAVLQEEDGRCFVYVISARRAEKRFVTVLSETDAAVIVEADSASGSLRAGDTVIVSDLDHISEGSLIS